MLRAVIVDDEPHVRDAMMELLGLYCASVEVVGTAGDIPTAINAIRAVHPDIVFLDIEMPERNGFELLAAFSPIPFHVVFVTAYDRYAIRAIKLSALDYLLKPVNPLELQGAVAKAVAVTSSTSPIAQGQIELMNDHARGAAPTRVVVSTEKGFTVVPLDDIVRCRSERNYSRLYLRDGKQIISSRTLSDYEEMFADAGFCRVHHSHLINMSHVVGYHKGKGGSVIMSDGSEVEVSVRRRDIFLRSIKKL